MRFDVWGIQIDDEGRERKWKRSHVEEMTAWCTWSWLWECCGTLGCRYISLLSKKYLLRVTYIHHCYVKAMWTYQFRKRSFHCTFFMYMRVRKQVRHGYKVLYMLVLASKSPKADICMLEGLQRRNQGKVDDTLDVRISLDHTCIQFFWLIVIIASYSSLMFESPALERT